MMKAILASVFTLLFLIKVHTQNTLTATYNSGDIPTSFDIYDSSCNGSSTSITITLPAGDNYEVTSVDINYTMISIGPNFRSHQRSKIRFANNGMEEAEVAGTGDAVGSQAYARTFFLANGTYLGATPLTFELHARRTVEGNTSGCNSSTVRVNAFSWTITVHYSNQIVNPKAGVNRTNPQAALHVNGRVRVGEETTVPVAGSIRYNTTLNDFEGFNGQQWISFTDKTNNGGWGNQNAIENSSATNTDTQADDNYGSAVDLHAGYAIVGSPRKNVGANADQGRVYLLEKVSNGWIQNATLNASDGAANDSFGYSVAIHGAYAVVGAPNKDIGANQRQGKAYVYFRTGTNTWTQQAILTASDGEGDDRFGAAVSIDGDYIIVGAPDDKVGTNIKQGSAYIFVRNNTTWTEQAKLVATSGLTNANFGNSVSIDGFYAAIGSLNDLVSGFIGRGSAYVFKRSGTTWAQQTKITAFDGGTNHKFGSSISIDSTILVVGAPNKGNNNISGGAEYGKVYIYNRISNNWTLQTSFIHPDGEGFDHFGYSVSVSGNNLAVGTPEKNVGNNNDQGKAYIYSKTGASTWTLMAQLASTDGALEDRFGRSAAIDGNEVMIGAPLKDAGSSANEGKVYFYNN
jgi:hypothetical protein